MNLHRTILLTLALLSLGAGRAALGQEAGSSAATDWSVFQSIAQKNIFDTSRTGRVRSGSSRPRAVVIRSFTFHGTIDDTALFTGEGAPAKGYVNVGDMINGFTVRKIPVEYVELPTVVLTDPGGAIVVLKEDESMRREDDGPWTKPDQPAPLVIGKVTGSPEIKTDDSAASSSPGPAGESDTLRRLRLKREQEAQ